MTLFGLAPIVIRPTALALNILVATIGTFQFWRAGHFKWNLFWPFALLSIPAAYLGGYLQPSASILRILIGLVLLFSAVRLIFRKSDPPQTIMPARATAVGVGAGLGFLSGLTGTGGGIFLTPLLLFCRWAHIKQAAAVSALFILVNSIGGLAGYFTKEPFHSVTRVNIWPRGDYRRRHRFASRKPPFPKPDNLGLAGNRADDCRREVNFYTLVLCLV